MERVAREIGTQIEQARSRLGLNQQTVAELAGTSRTYVSELELGKQTTYLTRLVDVLDVLGLEVVVRPRTERLGTTRG